MDIATALLQGQKLFEEAQISVPRLTAEVLLAHATGHDRTWLYAHSTDELIELWWIHYGRYLHQRLQGQPTQHITGRQEFYGRDFRVTPAVLIPRPETEHVIEAVLARAGGARTIIDIGTGSGAIAVTLALEMDALDKQVRLTATDVSVPALAVAAENARRLDATVDFVACDLGSALASGTFDVVVSNPPYVPESDASTIQAEVREHEPSVALYGGPDGLDVYRRLIPEAGRLLHPSGWLIMELGDTSGEGVRAMLEGWSDIEILNDLAGLPRVAVARKTGLRRY